MGLFKQMTNKQPKEIEGGVEVLEEQEMQQPTVEEQGQADPQQNQEQGIKVEKGILLFHDSNGDLRHQTINGYTLENITYYNAYLNKLTEKLWKEHMEGGE